ncbi:fibroin light chain-like [Maniola hyperantus]|uniref:fibroin light chain-like n=1 Tax=Aphantopus hyperantus TaxID=2795564 RepID=UPI003749B607
MAIGSALCLPTADVNLYDISEVSVIPDNGKLNRNVTNGVLAFYDGADRPLLSHILSETCNGWFMFDDSHSQAIVALQIIAILGETANGVPGDSCVPAALINTAVSSRGNLRAALVIFFRRIHHHIDAIVRLVTSPNAVRYSTGPRGNCPGGGRTYQFEEAWDRILDQCNIYQFALLNEQYCAAKRLYTAFNVRSNNIAAAFTAVTLPVVQQAALYASGPLSHFLRTVNGGGDLVHAAQAVKTALMRSLDKIDC